MHNLEAITALGQKTPRTDHIGDIRIAENAGFAMASVTARNGREDAVTEIAQGQFDVILPKPGAAYRGPNLQAFWLGPASWMFLGEYAEYEDLERILKSALGAHASVVEQTDAWCRFDISGASVDAMLERLCNVDVQLMAKDMVTRTRLEHLGCYLWCLEGHKSYAIIGPRSSAKSIHHALIAAAKSVSE